DWSPRPCLDPPRGPDRNARIGIDGAMPTRFGSSERVPCAMLRQGPQGSLHSPHETNEGSSALLGERTAHVSGNSIVPKFARRTHEFGLLSILAQQICIGRKANRSF